MTSHFQIILLFLAITTGFVNAEEDKYLSKKDAQALVEQMDEMLTKFNEGDTSLIVKKTHPSLIKLMGGDKEFKEVMKSAVDMLKESEFAFLRTDYGEPGKLYAAGDEEVCFVPKSGIMKVKDTKIKSTSFMVAIRTKGKDNWTFLDGAGFKGNPQMLNTLLPDLPKDIKLPEQNQEILKK